MRILILGGTTEASLLAKAVATDARFEPVLSLAGRTRNPVLPPIPCRIGGFGGPEGLADYLRETATSVVIDATHPFAARISANAVKAGQIAGVPLLAIHRPEWIAGPQDRWTSLPDLSAAAEALGTTPKRVLLTVGRLELAPFCARGQHHYVVRSVDAPDAAFLPADCTVIAARGPFLEEDEQRLLMIHKIEAIVTKNSGGSATSAKLAAARVLGIEVLMVRRPPALPRNEVESIPEVLDWLAAVHAGSSAARRGV